MNSYTNQLKILPCQSHLSQ